MADIELVIKIPEEVKNRLCFGVTYPKDIQVMCEALNNGTPLPKGHGRLIDATETLKAIDSWDKFGYSCHDMFRLTKESAKDYVAYVHYADMVKAVENAPTIIEADKGYKAEAITRGNCMICSKELDEGLFFCKECEAKLESEDKE